MLLPCAASIVLLLLEFAAAAGCHQGSGQGAHAAPSALKHVGTSSSSCAHMLDTLCQGAWFIGSM
jgi:hypothetical protein